MEVHVIRFQERVGRISKLRDVAVATMLESRGNSNDIRIEGSDIRSGTHSRSVGELAEVS